MKKRKLVSDGIATIEKYFEGIKITIPGVKNWSLIAFLSLLLIGWTIGESFAGWTFIHYVKRMLLEKNYIYGSVILIFLLVWLAFWTMGGYYAIISILYMFIGKQEVCFSTYDISISYKIGFLGNKKLYELTQIRDFKIAQKTEEESYSVFLTVPVGTPIFTFEYEGEPVEFGAGMNEKAMEKLIEVLKKGMYLKQGNFPKPDYWPEKEDIFKSGFKYRSDEKEKEEDEDDFYKDIFFSD